MTSSENPPPNQYPKPESLASSQSDSYNPKWSYRLPGSKTLGYKHKYWHSAHRPSVPAGGP